MLYGPNVDCHITCQIICHVTWAMSLCMWQYNVQYVVTILSCHYINDRRTIVIVSMTMSSGGHRSYLVTHLL
jgi:hypothetical protein